MKIYFTSAISEVTEEHRNKYKVIVKLLKDLGHRVIADHIIGKTAEILNSQTEEESLDIQRKMIAWKHQADLVVVEGSYPSFAVGQEISYSLTQNKPVIVLHLKNRRPHLLQAINSDYLYLVEYAPEKLKKVLTDYIEYARETMDTRFNFFISSEIEAFLDWIAKKRKLPRAVFLRQLIEEDMQRNRKYLKQIGKD